MRFDAGDMSNVKLLKFPVHGDDRGSLIPLDKTNLPLKMKRVFYMYNAQPDVRRGMHAHKSCNQLLICVTGSCRVLLDDGQKKETVLLDSPDKGLYVPYYLWREMFDFSDGAVLMAVADTMYDENDYIRDYQDFLNYYQDMRVKDDE